MHTIHVMDAPRLFVWLLVPTQCKCFMLIFASNVCVVYSPPKCQNNLNVLRKSSRRCCKAENSCVPVCIISIRIGANLYSSHNGKQTFYQRQQCGSIEHQHQVNDVRYKRDDIVRCSCNSKRVI